MSLTVDIAKIRALGPCAPGYRFALNNIDGPVSAAEARKAGCPLDDMAWYLSSQAPHDGEIDYRLRMWRADLAARVLDIFELAYPRETAAREAIGVARAFAKGNVDKTHLDATVRKARMAEEIASEDNCGRAAQAVNAARVCGEERASWVIIQCVRRCFPESDAMEVWLYDRLIEWFTADGPEPLALPERQIV